MKLKLQLSILFLLYFSLLFSQDNWMIYYASDGVSHIECGDGKIWVNSGSGLSSVDVADLSVERFHTLNSGIYYHTPPILTVDSLNQPWLNRYSGLFHFVNGELEVVDEVAGHSISDIKSAKYDHSGRLWVLGSFGPHHLAYLENDTFTVVPPPDSLDYFFESSDFTIDAQGHVWTIVRGDFFIPTFLHEFDGTSWVYHDLTSWQMAEAHQNEYISDQSGYTYCFLENPVDSNLLRWDGAQWTKMNVPLEASFRSFYVDSMNQLWVLQNNERLLKWDGQYWETIDLLDFGLPIGNPEDIELDEFGKLWVVYRPHYSTRLGTFLNVLQDSVFEIIDLSNSFLHSNGVEEIELTATQVKWLNVDYGLQSFDGSNWMFHGATDFPFQYGKMSTIAENYVWGRISSAPNAAVLLFDGADFEKINIVNENGSPYEDVWDLDTDDEGRALIAVNKSAIIRLNEDGAEYLDSIIFTHPVFGWQGFDLVREVAADSEGVIWAKGDYLHRYIENWEMVPYWDDQYFSAHSLFVEEGGNVYLQHGFPQDTLHRFNGFGWSMVALPEACSYCNIDFDSEGNLWAARQGLWKYTSAGDWEGYDIYNSPLPSNTIWDFEIDAFDNIWMATPTGLVVFNEDGIEDIGIVPTFESSEQHASLELFPNPTTGNLTVSSQIHFGEYQLLVTDIRGHTVKEQREWADYSISVELGDLLPGIYFIQVASDSFLANSVVIFH